MLKCGDSMLDLHMFSKFQRLVCNRLLVCLKAPETFVDSSASPANSCSCTDKIVSIECRVLNHDLVSVIVPGFASLVEDFVIRCYQVTKFFCSWNTCLIASSARNPRNFGS